MAYMPILFEVFGDAPIQCEERKLQAMVVFLEGIRKRFPNVMGW